MLPARARLSRPDDFSLTVRKGVRVTSRTLVLHLRVTDESTSRAGFIVSKAVGGAVVRNRVKRRLRHLVADRLDTMARAADVVVRALPAAATEPARLGPDLDHAWSRAQERIR